MSSYSQDFSVTLSCEPTTVANNFEELQYTRRRLLLRSSYTTSIMFCSRTSFLVFLLMVLHLQLSFSAPTLSSRDKATSSVSIHEVHTVIPGDSAPYASLFPSRIESNVDGYHQEKQHPDETLRKHIESLSEALDSEASFMIPMMSRTASPTGSSSSRINDSKYHPGWHQRKNRNHRMVSSSHGQTRIIDSVPDASHFVSFIHSPPSSHSWNFHTDSDTIMIPAASVSKPNVLSMQQLNPQPKMELPMMMPLPLTSALHKGMKQGMETMQSFMSQMQLMMPTMPSLSQMMPSLPMMHTQPSPCMDMGSMMHSMPMSMPQMAMPPKPDFMSMMQQLAQQLSPMNLINNMMNMMKSTQMAMGMGQQMSAAQHMSAPCMAGGD